MRNAELRFICKMQYLRVENAQTSFTRRYAPGQVVKFAIAHGEGNFVADDDTLRKIEAEGRVAFRYCDAQGRIGDDSNPNGAINSIAGVFNDRFNVLGLMPHPENLIDPLVGGIDGRALFASLMVNLRLGSGLNWPVDDTRCRIQPDCAKARLGQSPVSGH